MPRSSLFLVTVLLAAPLLPLRAQDPPVIRKGSPNRDPGIVAMEWLERMDRLSGKPVELDQFMEGSVIGARLEGSGHFVYADEGRFRSTMSISMQFQGQSEPRVQSMLMVGDGETIWTELRDTFLKVPLVNKMPLRLLSQAGRMPGVGFGGGKVHPIAQIRSVADMVVLDDIQEHDGVVVLKGAFTEAAKWKLGEQFFGLEVKTLTLALDAETGFPRSVRVDGAEDLYLEYRYTRVVHPKVEDLDTRQFQYEPPENAEVRDLEKVMQGNRQPPAGGG